MKLSGGYKATRNGPLKRTYSRKALDVVIHGVYIKGGEGGGLMTILITDK